MTEMTKKATMKSSVMPQARCTAPLGSLSKTEKRRDKKAFPLIAVREFILTRKSLGGIQTDLEGRVLDESSQPLSGLYAVGEAAGYGGGGIHGKGSLEGTFLGSCVLTGRIAGKSIGKAG